MISQLFRKWFGIDEPHCESCEILRSQLEKADSERRELLHRLLQPPPSETKEINTENFKPVTPQFIPWRVRQQMLEAEDRERARIMRQKSDEMKKSTEELEKELDINAT